ncbi:MAG: GNAT family N-acetyltransferase [Sedimentisphaerales bacterium]|nr:GNAT family N-acetyltransferase [Sedimentisphaerales bacterium]
MSSLESFSTGRLLAERLQQKHTEFIYQMHQEQRVMDYLGGIRSREQTQDYMEQNLSHWDRFGYGIWVLRENSTGDLIGRGGLRNAVLGGRDEVEVAYGLLPEFWNRGFATEFAEAVVRIGLSDLGLSDMACVTHPDNFASQRVLGKTGFVFEREVIYKREPYLLFRHDNRQI